MRATGIVRRVDDLGRVVIPYETQERIVSLLGEVQELVKGEK